MVVVVQSASLKPNPNPIPANRSLIQQHRVQKQRGRGYTLDGTGRQSAARHHKKDSNLRPATQQALAKGTAPLHPAADNAQKFNTIVKIAAVVKEEGEGEKALRRGEEGNMKAETEGVMEMEGRKGAESAEPTRRNATIAMLHQRAFSIALPRSRIFVFLILLFLLLLTHLSKASSDPAARGAPGNCSGEYSCSEGVVLPVWNPQNPSVGDKVARAIVYFVALIYMFLGMSIIADRFMSSIEVITSQEKEITIKKPNGETTTATVRIWNETVSNLTLMALGSSAPEILLSVIEVCGHKFKAGDMGPSTIVGSAAFNMFIIIALCVHVVPDGETRKIKHLRVFFVTAAWSIFAYIWLYLILSVFSPGVVQVWEAVLTFLFFPLCVVQAWVADRRLLFYKYVQKRYRADKSRGIIIETEGDGVFAKMDMELDGPRANSHHKEALDGMLAGVEEGGGGPLGRDQEEEARRDMARTLKELKQKHPEKDTEQLIEMANYQVLVQQQKSRAFYRIQATRMMIGAGNILKKHAADQARKAVGCHEASAQEDDPNTIFLEFEPSHYQCFENCGSLKLAVVRHGGDSGCAVKVSSACDRVENTWSSHTADVALGSEAVGRKPQKHPLSVDYRTEDGTANAGSDYEFAEGTLLFKPGETVKELTVGVIDDDIFEEDEYFYVHLSNPRVVHRPENAGPEPGSVATGNSSVPLPLSSVAAVPKAALGPAHTATVTIYDDDHAGIFTFESATTRVSESVGIMRVKVQRTSGARGKVAVPYHTVEGTAKAGEDYEETAGKLEFLNDETIKFPEMGPVTDPLGGSRFRRRPLKGVLAPYVKRPMDYHRLQRRGYYISMEIKQPDSMSTAH
ncbi:hypothetical protein Z043_113652 [Scleropages formosus]|uniref:Calx-beta domain-containing protein n=1 Tax=Scleropages formosus TaxID=113540 RepID=A0A0P7YJQ0_SCLFO|nr:hypothetical protein Z043_113652 [Scleropages formosus]